LSSLLLTVLGPAIWVKVLGHANPVFPIDPPALVTVPLAFLACVIASRYGAPTEPTPRGLRNSPPHRGKTQLEANQGGYQA
jgi:cation/acetate symporter